MRALSRQYPVWFCDIWGVVHNGYTPFATTCATLARHRAEGGTVVLVSNSPRSAEGVRTQLEGLAVPAACYDGIVTSGDVTRTLMVEQGGGRVFHLGPERDLSLFAGLPVARVPLADAHAVVCTGLFHDDRETPTDYAQLLADIKAQGLPMICANPDKVVRKGDTLLYCAGALADVYAALGGTVAMAGKPYAPIYDLALRMAASLRGKPVDASQVLAIGDGPETDIRGAASQGYPCVYVTGGVRDHVEDAATELAHVQQAVPEARILAVVPALHWADV